MTLSSLQTAVPWTPQDHYWMQEALKLAENGLYTTTPNPRVGCVIVNQGHCLGGGWTQPAGQDHAEIQALKAVQNQGYHAKGATVYVTLEPCSHYGRTPPCVEALITAQVARVVIAAIDPNPLVSGQGFAQLQTAGILVEQGLLADQARELNLGFFHRMQQGKPWVRLKLATSLDGHTALPDGHSQWLTGIAARQDGHRWRARACAVMTGGRTVRQDNPQLNVRGVETPRQPLRIVLSQRLPELARHWRLQDGQPVCWITSERALTRHNSNDAATIRLYQEAWPALEILPLLPADKPLDCPLVLTELAKRQLNEIHLEAGPNLGGAFIEANYVDELLLYWAPKLLGRNCHPLLNLPTAHDLDSLPFRFHRVDLIGEDIRAILRKNTTTLEYSTCSPASSLP